ncbi:hypothetical protein KEM48_006723 [Puccinia striiformis f. sp. tritici PST-130]|nr:hypothetical protein KEM48_006723 [Puccinia striiformis f. sp. tritici PST-130]
MSSEDLRIISKNFKSSSNSIVWPSTYPARSLPNFEHGLDTSSINPSGASLSTDYLN